MHDESYYEKLGFMCGLEIHQRLATEKKLFCACPAKLADGEAREERLVRYQRAVAGELGDVDRSARFEALKNRKFMYRIDERQACLVELDEEPPHLLDMEALEIALLIASSMKMRIVDELQPMRKEVVDGSNPSAFQRTIKIGMDGHLEVGKRRISIPSIFLEEESAGIEKSGQSEIVYNTARIGIPLIEIDTDPYISSPEQAKQIALRLGTLLRVSGKVQRGIGSIRQDVNVSIRGGARVEIKGLQDLEMLDRYVENEVARQQELLKIKAELGKRSGVEVEEARDITRLLGSCEVKIVKGALERKGVVIGFALRGFAGFLGREINPGRRLGTEISDYAKMGGVNGIFHSDEKLDGYGFSAHEIGAVKKALGATNDGDAFIMIAGDRASAMKAAAFAIDRAKYALVGVPLETRAAISNNDSFVTRFMRPLPGGSRMYPETDAVPVPITGPMLKKARSSARSLDKLQSQLVSELGNGQLVDRLILSPRLQDYIMISRETEADKEFIANVILQKFTELKRNGFAVDDIDDGSLVAAFGAYAKGEITKNGVEEVLKELAQGGGSVDGIIKRRGLGRISGKELHSLIEREFHGKTRGELVREVMLKYRLNIDGEELNNIANR